MLARAKINLGLEVGRRDRSGLHPVATILAELTLADELIAEPAPAWRLTVERDDSLTGPLSGWPERAEDNLISRAGRCMIEHFGSEIGCWHVTVLKRIPAGAGLGGGSSDAAAWIRMMAEHYPNLAERVWKAVETLGKDIGFFRRGGLQWGSGYGELLEPIMAPDFDPYVILANPGFPLSTSAVYQAFDQIQARRTSSRLWSIRDAIVRGAMPEALTNDLEPAAFMVAPELREFAQGLNDLAAQIQGRWWLTGSGSTYYILVTDEDRAEWLYGALKGQAAWTAMGRLAQRAVTQSLTTQSPVAQKERG